MQDEGQAAAGAQGVMRDVARGTPSSSPPSEEPSKRARARVGDILNDKWRLERLLGVGGMGAVYEALHRNGARAAVKVLHDYLAKDEEVRKRFLREGYAANRVEHASVVKVLDDDIVVGGPDGGTPYLVMELLVGESLEGRSRRGLAVSERELLIVADIVLEVLEVAHGNGVVHRDIKPDNIFITAAGTGRERVKVLDFGLARLLEGRALTVHGVALGTPPYMSPEQAAGRTQEIDGRTDLFALAATGFRLITGRRIHEGVSSVDLVQKMGKLAAPRVRTVAPEVSEALARVLDRALEFRREDRYESAAAMRADVRSALAVVGPGAPRTTPIGGGSYEPSIELSASDLEILKSVEIRGFQSIKSVELSASDLEVIKGDAVRAGEVAATGPAEPAKPSGVPPTAPMVVTPPVAQMPMQAIVAPTPSGPPAPAPQLLPAAPPTPPRQRSPLIVVGLAVVAVGVVCAGAAFAAGWFEESDTPSTASSGYSIPPAPTTHLSKPLPDDRSRTGKRPKH